MSDNPFMSPFDDRVVHTNTGARIVVEGRVDVPSHLEGMTRRNSAPEPHRDIDRPVLDRMPSAPLQMSKFQQKKTIKMRVNDMKLMIMKKKMEMKNIGARIATEAAAVAAAVGAVGATAAIGAAEAIRAAVTVSK